MFFYLVFVVVVGVYLGVLGGVGGFVVECVGDV